MWQFLYEKSFESLLLEWERCYDRGCHCDLRHIMTYTSFITYILREAIVQKIPEQDNVQLCETQV